MTWGRSVAGRVSLAAMEMFEAAVAFGFVSASAVAMAFGKLLLAVMLAAFSVGAFLRFKRRRAARRGGP